MSSSMDTSTRLLDTTIPDNCPRNLVIENRVFRLVRSPYKPCISREAHAALRGSGFL